MVKKLQASSIAGMINISFMMNGREIYCMRCDACGKFISKQWQQFYCPHCEISFLEGVSYDEMKGAEAIMDIVNLCDNYL